MKWLRYAFSFLGFVFEYIIPLILFGGVIPYTHDGVAAGFTKMGYIAIIVFLLIIGKKIKEKLLQREKSLARGIILSIFPIVFWLVINLGISWVMGFIDSLSVYWDKIILFIILGRLFYTAEEAMHAKEAGNE